MKFGKRLIAVFLLMHGVANGQQVADIGKNNWIFPTSWEYRPGALSTPNADIEQSISIVSLVKDALKARGTTLIMAVAPAKMRIYPEYLPDTIKPDDKFISRYDRIQKALKEKGVIAADLLNPMMLAKRIETETLYLPQDSHWSPTGALVAGRSVAQIIRSLKLDKDITSLKYNLVKLAPQDRRGDLLSVLTADQKSAYGSTVDRVVSYSFEKESTTGLLDNDLPQITLTGSSYSGDGYKFGDAIGYSLQADVLTVWKPALGQWKAIMDYASDDSFQSASPKVIVWDLIEREWDMPPSAGSVYKHSNHFYLSELLANIYNVHGDLQATLQTANGQQAKTLNLKQGNAETLALALVNPKYSYISFTYRAAEQSKLTVTYRGQGESVDRVVSLTGDGQSHQINLPYYGNALESLTFASEKNVEISNPAIYRLPVDITTVRD